MAAEADHGGGDVLLLRHVFQGVKKDPLGLAADYVDGARSILIGIAANKSIASGQPVYVSTLVHFCNITLCGGMNKCSPRDPSANLYRFSIDTRICIFCTKRSFICAKRTVK